MTDKPMPEAKRLCDSHNFLAGFVGNVPLPERGLSAADLMAWWGGLVAQYREAVRLRDEPWPEGHENCMDCQRRRYQYKCDAKTVEYLLAPLHAALAPEAPFVCDENCPHVREGMSPEQVKRFIDPIKRSIANSEAYLKDHYDADWARDERDDEKAALRSFLKRLGQPEYAEAVMNLEWKGVGAGTRAVVFVTEDPTTR